MPDPTPPFVVEVVPDGEQAHVVPHGDLDMATTDRVAASIDELVRAGCDHVVLDLRRVTFMDSAGVRLVVQQTRRTDRTVQVIDGNEPVARVFDLTGLREHLPFVAPSA
jgi:anti-sigma B factor antagonist